MSVGEERFAISQVNVDELLSVPAAQIGERIEMVGGAEVLLLRGELIPLLYLSTILDLSTNDCQAARTIPRMLGKEHEE